MNQPFIWEMLGSNPPGFTQKTSTTRRSRLRSPFRVDIIFRELLGAHLRDLGATKRPVKTVRLDPKRGLDFFSRIQKDPTKITHEKHQESVFKGLIFLILRHENQSTRPILTVMNLVMRHIFSYDLFRLVGCRLCP